MQRRTNRAVANAPAINGYFPARDFATDLEGLSSMRWLLAMYHISITLAFQNPFLQEIPLPRGSFQP
jgi:hypothetical protein